MGMDKKKLMIYTDCPFFGGCETIIANILASHQIRAAYNLIFAYRYSNEYYQGMRAKIQKSVEMHPLYLINNQEYERNLMKANSPLKRKIVQLFSKIIYTIHRFQIRLDVIVDFLYFLYFFKKNNPDILHINNGGYPASVTCRIAVFAASLVGVKRIIFQVNNLATVPVGHCEELIDKALARRVRFFITCSNAAGKRLHDARHFEEEKIISIPNTIKEQERYEGIQGTLRKAYAIPDQCLVAGSVGLLTRRKGMHVLLESIKNLQSEHLFEKVDVQFFIFGEGEEKGTLLATVRKYGLEKRVSFPGFKANVIEYMKDMDLFILPSLKDEDFPNVILEAMLLKKPIIGTNVGGIPEQVAHDMNGLIVKPGSVSDLQLALKSMLGDREKMLAFGLQSYRMYKEKYEYSRIMGRYFSLYKSVS
jgi:glycosyltransferase involved in cell wall biosynthesis